MSEPFTQLPDHWILSRIDRIASVNARIGWKALTADEYQLDGYVFLSTPNIKGDQVNFEDVNYISSHRYEESPELKLAIGDVLLVKDGNTLGITNLIVDLPRPATVNGSIAVIRPFGVHPGFLRYVLASGPSQERISAMKGGMGVPHLFQWDIKRFPIPLPPLDEQLCFTEFLDAENAGIDSLIAKKRHMIELLDDRAVSVIATAFGMETGFSAVGVPNSVGQHPMVRLGAVATVQSGLTLDSGRDLGDLVVTRPYLRVANVQDGRVDLSEVKEVTVPRAMAVRCELKVGDVLMTEGGDADKLGRGAVWRGEVPGCLHQNHIFAVRPGGAMLPEFLALLSRTPYARAYFEATASKTTGIASTSTSKIAAFRVPLPQVEEQHQIVDDTKRRLAKITNSIERIDHQIDLVREHRQALITAAVAGELETPEVVAG